MAILEKLWLVSTISVDDALARVQYVSVEHASVMLLIATSGCRFGKRVSTSE
jgi:hypothetical protein